jgi:3-oxoacyl-[acyl-carrier-protein] synthase II
MKEVYVVDYIVRDSLGTDVASNYINMPATKGPQPITRYNTAEYPQVLSTNGFQMDYIDGDALGYKTTVEMINEMSSRYTFPKNTAVCYGTFAASFSVREGFDNAFDSGQRRYSPTKLFTGNHDLLAALVSGKMKLEGINTSLNAACSSSMFNLHFANMLIQSGQTSTALVGAVDFSLWPRLQYYWQCTSAISTANGGTSIPFDAARDGFLQGEGGTMWFICDEQTLKEYNLTPKARLLSTTCGSKVTSMTAHDRTCENQTMLINQALTLANRKVEDISFFNAHATSTLVGDDIELEVFQKVFKDIDIPIVSFKGYIGHTMSACGMIESAYGLEAVRNGYLNPNHGIIKPLSDDPRIITKQRNLHSKTFMKASFGFGGRTSIAIFEAL